MNKAALSAEQIEEAAKWYDDHALDWQDWIAAGIRDLKGGK